MKEPINCLPVLFMGLLLSACGGGGGGSSGDDTPVAAKYSVNYQAPEGAFEGVNSQLNIVVSKVAKQDITTMGAAQSAAQSYSVEVAPHPAFMVQNECSNIPLGTGCQLFVSLSDKAKEKENFTFSVVLPSGAKKNYIVPLVKKKVQMSLSQESVLPTNKVNKIIITNNHKQTMYIDTPQFVDNKDKLISNVVLTDNTCKTAIAPGASCHFNLKSPLSVQGKLKLTAGSSLVHSLGFSNVVITSTRTEDLPENIVKGMSYPVTYTFTNTSSKLAATNIHFSNSFPEGEYVIDHANSSCEKVTELLPNTACTWTGRLKAMQDGERNVDMVLHYAEGSEVGVHSSAHVSTVVINGVKIEDVPENSAKGQSYPFIYSFSNSGTKLSATGINFTNVVPDSYKIDSKKSSCEHITTLAPGASCTLQGSFTPTSEQDDLFSSTLHYNEGADVILSASSSVSNVVVTKEKLVDVPKNVAKGISYPFSYRFVNTNTKLPATEVSFSNVFPSEVVIDEKSSSCKGVNTLAPSGSCIWQGTFTPVSDGNKSISATLHYKEGVSVGASSTSLVTTVTLTAEKLEDLPENMIKGNSYPFIYRFNNTNKSLAATELNFQTVFPEGGVSIDEKESSCKDLVELPANSSCTWRGVLSANEDGEKSIRISAHYKEGDNLSLQSISSVSAVVVEGEKIKAIPANTKNWLSYPFTYSFVNTSAIHPATNIHFDNIIPETADIDIANSSCKGITTLPPGGSCTWSGVYTPAKNGYGTISFQLHYDEGSTVVSGDTTQVVSVSVVIRREINTPKYIAPESAHEIHYTFHNTSLTLPATELNFTTSIPTSGFTVTEDTCTGLTELAPNTTCSFAGEFKLAAGERAFVEASMGYREIGTRTVGVTNEVEAMDSLVTAEFTVPIPKETMVNKTYPFEISYHNEGKFPVQWHSGTLSESSSIVHVSSEGEDACQNAMSFAPGATCHLRGSYTPTRLLATGFSYNIPQNNLNQWYRPVSIGYSGTSYLPTSPIKTDPKDTGLTGWSWPEERFIPAKYKDSEALCEGALYDTLTGSVWLAGVTKLSFNDAVNYAASENHCGYRYRLPTVLEAATLLNDTVSGEDGLSWLLKTFPSIDDSEGLIPQAWLSTPSYALPYQLVVRFGDPSASFSGYHKGSIRVSGGTVGNQVMLLITPPDWSSTEGGTNALIQATGSQAHAGAASWPSPRFEAGSYPDGQLCDDALYDRLTGIMWQKEVVSKGLMNGFEMKELVNSPAPTICGYHDWRVPTIYEIMSLNDTDRSSWGDLLVDYGFLAPETLDILWAKAVNSAGDYSTYFLIPRRGELGEMSWDSASQIHLSYVRGPDNNNRHLV